MTLTKYSSIVLVCALAPAAHSQDKPHQYKVKGGCVLWAQAYTNKAYGPRDSSRYTLQIFQTPKNSHQWDLTAPEFPNEHSVNIDSPNPHPYGRKRRTTLYATLHQYRTYAETVTFHNLDLGPVAFNLFGKPSSELFGDPVSRPHHMPTVTPRYLILKEPVTAATPSGVTITLPTQGEETLERVFSSFNGNASALFIQIRTSPSQKLAVLPLSPLYKKSPKPVRITLDCVKPNYMVWYMADAQYTVITGINDAGQISGYYADGSGNLFGFYGNFNPVPEASSVVSFGLLLTFGLGSVVVAARRRKSPAAV